MPITVAHAFSNNLPDVTGTVTIFDPAAAGSTNTVLAASIVKPSNWNSNHDITYQPVGSEIIGAFSNGGNVTFGTDGGGYITASAPSGGGGAATVFSNSNNVSFGLNGSTITATATFAQTAHQFSNSNGVTFGTNGSTVTASVKTDYLTTAMQSNAGTDFMSTSERNNYFFTSNNTFANSTHSHGAIAFSGTNVSATFTSQSNGLSMQLSAAAGGAQTGISGIIAGTQTQTVGTLSFANSNGISFGLSNSSVLTASYTVPSQTVDTNKAGTGFTSTTTAGTAVVGTLSTNGLSVGVPAYLTTYVNDLTSGRAGTGFTSTTTAGTVVVGTLNTNGLSIGVPAYITTAAQSTQPVAVSGSNGSFTYSTLSMGSSNGMHFYTTNGSVVGSYTVPTVPGVTVFSNSNNVSFGLNGSTVTATATFAQSNQTINLYATANSAQLSSTAGIDARSLSFAGAGIASVGVSNGVVLVSVPSGGGAGDGVNIVQMGTTGTTGTTFSASTGTVFINGGNNITVSQNASNQIVISAAQGGIAAGSQTATSGTLVFANSNGVTFGMSGASQITASVAAGGVTLSNWEPFAPIGGGVAFSTMGQNSIYLQRLLPGVNVAFNNVERIMSGSTVSSTNSQVAAHTYNYGLYSKGTGASTSIYSQIATSQLVISASFNSNTAAGYTISQGAASFTSTSAGTALFSALTGFKHLYLPFTSTITAGGEYAWAMRMSSATTVGTSPLRIGLRELSNINNLTIGKVYATTVLATNASFVGDFAQGVYSATSSNLPSTIALSGLTNAVSQQRMYLQFDS